MMVSRRAIVHALAAVAVHTLAFATGAAAESWTRAYVNALPDEAFAVVHVRQDGTKSRHLPHHDAEGQLDLAHLRNALARLDQVHWEDPVDAERARQHLLVHQEALGSHRRAGWQPLDGRGIEGPPPLVIEIPPPSTTRIDRGIKAKLYRRYRVPHYWIVDPDAQTIEAYRLVERRYAAPTLVSGTAAVSLPPFPDLRFALTSVWP